MPRTAAVALLLASFVVAAPVPKPPPKTVEDLFGTVADPSGPVQTELTRERGLRVTVPKDYLAADSGGYIPPQVFRKADEDFEVTVRIQHRPGKDADATPGTNSAVAVSAGIALFVDGDPKKYVSFQHKHTKKGDDWASNWHMSSRHARGGSGTGRQMKDLETDPIYLRLTREGDTFRSQYSADGEKWTAFGTHKVPDFGPVVVGLVAYHNTDAEYEAVFDEFELKPLKAEAKE